ncbi:hypothetical protein PpBr36_02733 [Pyricularia pennisetigena]|uniref:hypothetical protein n=1 Tax=Pyricularia pennisetigena TaxID=1578925 RepID=UPI00115175EB|nr:hypothetical protein PpBr36_02733 [Pyricularia pennisetigena]TLS30608.1 hypothetical protein PpBr36_02733 [Pyricularia pennisetigena]
MTPKPNPKVDHASSASVKVTLLVFTSAAVVQSRAGATIDATTTGLVQKRRDVGVDRHGGD